MIRKEVDTLSVRETRSLVRALRGMQADHSPDGFQDTVSFHALPPLCPSPDAADRYACCVHGMATFPHWHRLFTVQFEDSLRRHGSIVGVPYWDWTKPMSSLPSLLADKTYMDPITGESFPNPFHHGEIEIAHEITHRDINAEKLFETPSLGDNTWLFNHIVYALEQTNFCDFEIQFEIVHNSIHAWIGGHEQYSIGHLHYAAFDPAFFLHHSNTDRLFAIWQALQEERGIPSKKADCAIDKMHEPLKPFSFGAPYNYNPVTKAHSMPAHTFDYRGNLNYDYDHLSFGGKTIAQLEIYIQGKKEHDRVFAGFMLKGFGSSATITFDICPKTGDCHEGGYFHVLGGSAEMKWSFDRLYKYEITDTLTAMNLRPDDPYNITIHIVAMNGSVLPSSLLNDPTVVSESGKGKWNHLAHHTYSTC